MKLACLRFRGVDTHSCSFDLVFDLIAQAQLIAQPCSKASSMTLSELLVCSRDAAQALTSAFDSRARLRNSLQKSDVRCVRLHNPSLGCNDLPTCGTSGPAHAHTTAASMVVLADLCCADCGSGGTPVKWERHPQQSSRACHWHTCMSEVMRMVSNLASLKARCVTCTWLRCCMLPV